MFDNMTKKIIAGLSVFLLVFTLVCVPTVTKANDNISVWVGGSSGHYYEHEFTDLYQSMISSAVQAGVNVNSLASISFIYDTLASWSPTNPQFIVNVFQYEFNDSPTIVLCFSRGYGFTDSNISNNTFSFTSLSSSLLFDDTVVWEREYDSYQFPNFFGLSSSSVSGYIGLSSDSDYPNLNVMCNAGTETIGYYNTNGFLVGSSFTDTSFHACYNLYNPALYNASSSFNNLINGTIPFLCVYIHSDFIDISTMPLGYAYNPNDPSEGSMECMFGYGTAYSGSRCARYLDLYSGYPFTYNLYGFLGNATNIFVPVVQPYIYGSVGPVPTVGPSPTPTHTPSPTPTTAVYTPPPTYTPIPTGSISSNNNDSTGWTPQDVMDDIEVFIDNLSLYFNGSFASGVGAMASYLFESSSYWLFMLLCPVIALLTFIIGRFHHK